MKTNDCPLIVTASCAAVLFAGIAAAQDAPAKKQLTPDPKIQAKIDAYVTSEPESTRQVMLLQAELADWMVQQQIEPEELFEQLLLYSVKHRDFYDLARSISVVGLLSLRASRSEMAETIAILLNLDEQSDLQKSLLKILCDIDKCDSGDCLVFEHYEDVLGEPSPPRELARYMFHISAHQAFVSMIDALDLPESMVQQVVTQERAIDTCLWKQKFDFIDRDAVTPEAEAAFQNLAQRDEWWVQLYVIAIMARHDEFRDEQIVEALAKSKHEIVRKGVKRLSGEDKNGPPAVKIPENPPIFEGIKDKESP